MNILVRAAKTFDGRHLSVTALTLHVLLATLKLQTMTNESMRLEFHTTHESHTPLSCLGKSNGLTMCRFDGYDNHSRNGPCERGACHTK